MLHEFSRTELLIGREALEKLQHSKVAVFGVGGVGSFAVEALTRAGVGKLVLVDNDVVCLTNLNRQLLATQKTLGRPKVEVMKERILEINPQAEVTIHQAFYLPGASDDLIQDDYDYIVDAVDTVSAKIDLVVQARKRNIPIISSMGAGNKMDPTRFRVSDIYKTSVDPLAKVMRRELRNRGIDSLKVVYSTEPPLKPMKSEEESRKRQIPGSISFVPSVVGLIIAGEVVKDLIGYSETGTAAL
ncbi:tRNA threonylcarbamoyladenosine dehydratase [Thermoclostridium caenicola]|uniref:tRNA A37 threonylcarbamoyladenosine dehydratase n=1 Tax=Thermoclostridium caenicola TaxID=659425 RepID=A0A1M6JZ12_9FIRM|nr:tRNA threonylcarbamoyladenosine dehydratase [Thermoclostridium caenicola]SHJ51970.1 tRNA A37 threonylcarbamoyladenosine dehydratase [Thermoclostridium caenicola]HOP71825.1 tRNA threonylcarbamoyladenosine dehydratase [Thermoclostridium caenicola]HPU21488.1 tRNA threonylcarbamoyladenosine dehydratase [Thermoclostridium caenicola]